MNIIAQPSFRSSEKRKAKALRQSVTAVNSFGFSSTKSDSPPFSPGFYTSSISSAVVTRYLLNNNGRNSSPHRRTPPPKSNKAEGTPLFASQQNTYSYGAADGGGSHHESNNAGLFGYSCKDDASVASSLRHINGGGVMLRGLNEAPPSSVSLGVGATTEQLHNVKKRLRYTTPQQSNAFDVDLSSLLDIQCSSKILSASSIDGYCGSSSSHSTEDGTVHDDWIIEDDDWIIEDRVACTEITNGIDAFETSLCIAFPESKARSNLEQPSVKEACLSNATRLL